MGTSTIDGTLEEAILRRASRGTAVFSSLRFRSIDGQERTVKNAVTTQAIADELTPGSRARFYLFTAFDIKGVHGVRLPDGRAVYGFPGNNAKIFLVLGIVNILWITLLLFTEAKVPMLGVLMLVLAIVGYFLMSKSGRETRAHFEGDAQAPASSGATA